jgi:hypothetical protein
MTMRTTRSIDDSWRGRTWRRAGGQNRASSRRGGTLARVAGALAALGLCLSLAHAKKMGGDGLSDMIIRGENRLTVHPRVDAIPWSVTPDRDVPELLKDNAVIGQFQPPAVSQPPVATPAASRTAKAASPWLSRVHEPPVLTLELAGAAKVERPEWTFLVKDSQGQVFYEMKRKGALPARLEWDGRGAGGEPLRVGTDYAYTLSVQDEAGNPQRFAGEAFRLAAFRVARLGKETTMLQPEALFEGRSSAKLSREGKDWLLEVKDRLRPRFGKSVDVVAYDDDQGLALARAKAVRQFLQEALEMPDDKIAAKGSTMKEGRGYRHVDVTVD